MLCKHEGCDNPVKAVGYCMTHYQRARRAGYIGLSLEEIKIKEKEINLKSHHNITLDDYRRMLWVEQMGKCALCKKDAPTYEEMLEGRFWPVDHDRECCPGIPTRGDCIRGILCVGCNSKLHRDIDEDWLLACGTYLGIWR